MNIDVNSLVELGVTVANVLILAGLAIAKKELKTHLLKHGGAIETVSNWLENELGTTQYNADVAIIKNALNELNKQFSLITLAEAEKIAIALNDKVHLTKDDIIKEIFNLSK